jgi:hypothetical protein
MTNLLTREVLPTPESPSNTTFFITRLESNRLS